MKSTYPLIEVVMLTAHATVESAIEGMKFGAFDYLMKPCDMDLLMGKVNEATCKKRDHEEKIREAHIKEILTKRVFVAHIATKTRFLLAISPTQNSLFPNGNQIRTDHLPYQYPYQHQYDEMPDWSWFQA